MHVMKTRQRGWTLKEMLKKQHENSRFHQLLCTALDLGYFAFDEAMFTKLTIEERREVHKIARQVPQLHDFEPLPFLQTVPTRLGSLVERAEPVLVPDLDEFKFFRVCGDYAQAIVQARYLLTLVKRHPVAKAYFRAGDLASRSPITFIENRQVVALLMPVEG